MLNINTICEDANKILDAGIDNPKMEVRINSAQIEALGIALTKAINLEIDAICKVNNLIN